MNNEGVLFLILLYNWDYYFFDSSGIQWLKDQMIVAGDAIRGRCDDAKNDPIFCLENKSLLCVKTAEERTGSKPLTYLTQESRYLVIMYKSWQYLTQFVRSNGLEFNIFLRLLF